MWTCVVTLSILDRLDVVNQDMLAWWLSERQLPNGGLNGRPEKLEDVCYSWWAIASLAILGKQDWIDQDKLASFILSCQVSQSCFAGPERWMEGRETHDISIASTGHGARRNC